MRTKIGGHFKHKFSPKQNLQEENLLLSAKKLSANHQLTTLKDGEGRSIVKEQNTSLNERSKKILPLVHELTFAKIQQRHSPISRQLTAKRKRIELYFESSTVSKLEGGLRKGMYFSLERIKRFFL